MSKAIYLIDDAGKLVKHKKVYETNENGVFRKIKKGYVVDENHINRLFFSAGPRVMYTGEHTIEQIVVNGLTYNLLTMIKAGTLTIDGGTVQCWICGAGSGGCTPSDDGITAPIGGSGGFVDACEISPGVYLVQLGAGGYANANGGDTIITDANGTEVLVAKGGKFNGPGGSGGAGAYGYKGSIDPQDGGGMETVPFGITELHPHSAGGGAGGVYFATSSDYSHNGGNGGSNGSPGTHYETLSNISPRPNPGEGGEKGGGKGGGNPDALAAVDYATSGETATFPGSAGGGAGVYMGLDGSDDDAIHTAGDGGRGYQGIGYILWHEDDILFEWVPFRIVAQPVGGITPCTMTCTATGVGVTYQWQRGSVLFGNTSWSDITGATTDTYQGTVSGVMATHTQYRCKVTDEKGTVLYSDAVSVTKA